MVNAVLHRLRSPDGSSVTNSQLSPAQQTMCSEAVALSLSIGLPIDIDLEEEEGAMIICDRKGKPSIDRSDETSSSLLQLLSMPEGDSIDTAKRRDMRCMNSFDMFVSREDNL